MPEELVSAVQGAATNAVPEAPLSHRCQRILSPHRRRIRTQAGQQLEANRARARAPGEPLYQRKGQSVRPAGKSEP